MSSNINNNSNFLYDRLYLKNIPYEITRNQLKDIYFKELENIDIHFPKNKLLKGEKKVAFIQFGTANEGKLARSLINVMDWRDIQANFANKSENIKTHNWNKKNGNPIIDFEAQIFMKTCSYCGEPNSEFICSDCSDTTFYCSEDHQLKDWPKHRTECKPLPKLKRVNPHTPESKDHFVIHTSELDENCAEEELESPKSKYCIRSVDFPSTPGSKFVITYVSTNRVIYVRAVNNVSYEGMLDELHKFSMIAPKIQNKPKINDYVFAPLNETSYHRARIQDTFEVDSDECNVRVFFIDIGCEAKLKWNTLKRLTYKLRGMPIFTFKVMLDGVKIGSSELAIQYLKNICNQKDHIELISISTKPGGERKAIFKNVNTGIIINEYINELVFHSISKARADEKIYYDNEMVPMISRTKNVKLGIADSSQLGEKNYLACMPYDLFSEYNEMCQKIQEFCKKTNDSENDYTPALNEIHLLWHNNQWQRAINAKSDLIILIDKMITISAENHEIRRQIPQLFAKKLFTSLCYVKGLHLNDKIKLLNVNHAIFNVSFDVKTKCIVLDFVN